ncbi:MAG TPA: hypothetical protein VL576_00525 [Candidatus Paceibacterota bacterium]|jgi:hypothetical protein|nr:hypothetical protein [Candidatus Paceibacterota bacterium]
MKKHLLLPALLIVVLTSNAFAQSKKQATGISKVTNQEVLLITSPADTSVYAHVNAYSLGEDGNLYFVFQNGNTEVWSQKVRHSGSTLISTISGKITYPEWTSLRVIQQRKPLNEYYASR